MSKQADAKIAQGYTKEAPCCARCISFTSTVERVIYRNYSGTKETNIRCSLGGFKVSKMAYCNRYEAKP
jgi:hypothetical protein